MQCKVESRAEDLFKNKFAGILKTRRSIFRIDQHHSVKLKLKINFISSFFMTYREKISFLFRRFRPRTVVIVLVLICCHNHVRAQCPANLDFETGTFAGWTLYTGTVDTLNQQNIIHLGLVPAAVINRHTILVASPEDSLKDFYGDFPLISPDGSRYFARLGNDSIGAQAEGMSYDFTIPASAHHFSITYYYAIVLENPGHPDYEQPRMVVEVHDFDNSSYPSCHSFPFISSGGLPGFYLSPHIMYPKISPDAMCRNWSAYTINFEGHEGETFRLFFKTADCALGGHFAYAYIDVSSNCSGELPGTTYCPADTAVNLNGPAGYQSYKWLSSDFSQVLGTQQQLHLSPPPAAGTSILLEVTPYPGYGCTDTLTATFSDTLTVFANAGGNRSICTNPVRLGILSARGVQYYWSPGQGLNDSTIANPYALPDTTTTYTLTVSSFGGGCVAVDHATVTREVPAGKIILIGDSSYCAGTAHSTVLQVYAADSIQWYQNGNAIPGANHTQYTVTESGNYNATLFSLHTSCSIITAVKRIDIYPVPHAGFTLNNITQCSPLDSFIVTNTSSISSGQIHYLWNFGDGATDTSAAPVHTYALPGSFTIQLHTSAAGGCSNDTSIEVLVKPGAAPDFTAQNICINLDLPLVNNTRAPGASSVNYLWSFGNGDISNQQNPVYSYTTAGDHIVSLSAATPECPEQKIKTKEILISEPAPDLRYADHPAIINFHESLEARPIGITVLWSPVTYLDNAHSYKPEFRSDVSQQYTVTLTTKEGCVTTDTVLVKVYKKIEIHVPTAFTPNGDGNNDVLRPLLFSFKKVNYFRVYNRLGQLLFESQDDQKGWDGTYRGMKQEMQTVIWTIEAEDVDGHIHTATGTTVLMR
jgi:gliding motility-associated-like protein